MKNNNYITIQGWMVNDLKLSGNDLICYAIIYGFSQDDNYWEGSQSYLSEWMGISRRCTIDILNRLTQKGYIDKQEYEVNKVKFCKYKAIVPNFTGYEDFAQGGSEDSSQCINNIYNKKDIEDKSSISKENIDWDEIKAKWKEFNPNLEQPRMLNDKRKNAIRCLLKNNNATIDDLYNAFKLISISSFCQGRNKNNWKATFDWLIYDTKGCFNRVLEGVYAYLPSEMEQVKKIKEGDFVSNGGNYNPISGVDFFYNEFYKTWMYIGYDTSFIPDGYNADNRPNGAKVTLNNARGNLIWNAADKRWEKE